MDICERIKEIIACQNMTIASFARKIGVGDQTIRGIVVQKRNKPGYDVILKIVQTFEWLNVEWLITGKGSMRVKNEEPRVETPMSMDIFLNYLREKDRKIEELLQENTQMRMNLGIDTKRSNKQQVVTVPLPNEMLNKHSERVERKTPGQFGDFR